MGGGGAGAASAAAAARKWASARYAYRRAALIPGAGAASARSVASSFHRSVAPASQNLTALNATVAVEATATAVGGRSLPQAAASSAAGPNRSIRLNMVPASVRWWIARRIRLDT